MDAWVAEFAKYGLAGLCIVGLTYAVRVLFNKYDEAQKARIAEGLAALDIIKSNTASQDVNTQSIKELTRVIQSRGGTGA